MDTAVNLVVKPIQIEGSRLLQMRSYTQIVSVLILALEVIHTFGDEVEYIWRAPRSLTKVIYLSARYYALAYQLADLGIVLKYLSQLPINPRLCYNWSHFQIISFLIIFHLLESLLVLRVYSLYKRDRRITNFVTSVYLGEISAGFGVTVHAYLWDVFKLDNTCFPSASSSKLSMCSVVAFIHQSLLWYLIFTKKRDTDQPEWFNKPVIKIIFHNGAFITFGIFLIFTGIIPYSISAQNIVIIIRTFLASLFSIATCRLVMSMHKLKYGSQETSIELNRIPVNDYIAA
ncbi:hypothetical protein AX17_006638 [Amanita inopinata Kibby_2008]|nr:hypothetical protein AX17_006638 [Amanita inopinata Kibby_2008]